jgi:hypothetical protein
MSEAVPPPSLCGFIAWRGTAVLYVHSFGLKFLSDDLKEGHSTVPDVSCIKLYAVWIFTLADRNSNFCEIRAK